MGHRSISDELSIEEPPDSTSTSYLAAKAEMDDAPASIGRNADTSETIKDRELGFRFRSLVRSASLLCEYAITTLTPTKRPNLWRPQFSC